MPNRIMVAVISVTLLTAAIVSDTSSQTRQRSPRRPDKAPVTTKSSLIQEAETENRKFWETLYVKCGDSYLGEVAPGLSQMRIVTFSVSPKQLTDVDKENGYEWRGNGVMRFSRRRMLTFGRWSDWVAADQDWMTGGKLTAVLQKKGGEWSALYSPFDRSIIAKKPTCAWLEQFGIPADHPVAQPTPVGRPTHTARPTVRSVTVSDFAELVAAIAPNTTIKMQPGYYVIDPAVTMNNPHVSFAYNQAGDDVMTNQTGLTIKNVNNLSIIGLPGDKKVELIQPNESQTVLIFNKVSDITIDNIEAGHSRKTSWCTAGVLTFYDSSGIKISRSKFHGSGTIGLTLYNVRDFEFINSMIRDCSWIIMQIGHGSDGIRFADSKFIDSGLLDLIVIEQSNNISFARVEITGNKSKEWSECLFYVEDGENVTLTNSKIKGNDAGWLEFTEGSIRLDSSNEIDFKQFRSGKSRNKK